MIVEDHLGARDVMRGLLEADGATVSVTNSADDALTIMSTLNIDVVLTDIALRGATHDGVWLFEQIAASSRPMPVIAVTGRSDREAELGTLGFAAVLVKPFGVMDLAALILGVINSRRP